MTPDPSPAERIDFWHGYPVWFGGWGIGLCQRWTFKKRREFEYWTRWCIGPIYILRSRHMTDEEEEPTDAK